MTTTTTTTVQPRSMVRLVCDSAAAWGARAAVNVHDAIHTIHNDNIGYDDFETAAYECAIMAAHVAGPVADLMTCDPLELEPVGGFAMFNTLDGAARMAYAGRSSHGRIWVLTMHHGPRVVLNVTDNNAAIFWVLGRPYSSIGAAIAAASEREA